MTVSKLRSNFKQFEARRKLKASYDLFLMQDGLDLVLPGLLGKVFYKHAAGYILYFEIILFIIIIVYPNPLN